MRAAAGVFGIVAMFAACGGGEAEPPCVAALEPACAPTYDPPVFDTIFYEILLPTCGGGRANCHSAQGRNGDLIFDDIERAYAGLVGPDRELVRAGDPSCSRLTKRLYSPDPNYHMPPGSTSLTDGELCTITRWIRDGAAR